MRCTRCLVECCYNDLFRRQALLAAKRSYAFWLAAGSLPCKFMFL